MRESVEVKARRLYLAGSVRTVTDRADKRKFEVDGDSATYLVRWYREAWTCTCPSTRRCSHELAAVLHWSNAHRAGNIIHKQQGMETTE